MNKLIALSSFGKRIKVRGIEGVNGVSGTTWVAFVEGRADGCCLVIPLPLMVMHHDLFILNSPIIG